MPTQNNKTRKRVSPYKMEQRKTDVTGAIGDGYSELQSLRDDMREWADNMEGGNMGHMEKCQTVTQTADDLDNVADNEPTIPEELGGLEVTYTEMVPRRKGRAASRSTRCSNAVAMLQGAIDALEGRKNDLPETDDSDKAGGADEIDELVSDLQEAVDAAEGAEFPGMYG